MPTLQFTGTPLQRVTLTEYDALSRPIAVTLNFRRFHDVQLLKIKKLTFAADDEEDALTLGSLYMRAPFFEKLWQ